jgi:hypothetical protein
MLAIYALLILLDFSIYTIIALFGIFVAIAMLLVRRRHLYNVKTGPLPLVPSDAHH